jgi:hypothetical protein
MLVYQRVGQNDEAQGKHGDFGKAHVLAHYMVNNW